MDTIVPGAGVVKAVRPEPRRARAYRDVVAVARVEDAP